jgi:diguanylate cyclase (GGDEF)-like protein
MKRSFLSAFTINQTLIISHILLVLMLILGMSISRYNYEWELHVKQAAQRAEDVLLFHVKQISLLVSGRNYTTLMLPSNVDALYRHRNLLFLDIKGFSEHQSKLFHVRYLRKNKSIWREDISLTDIEQIRLVKDRFERLLKATPESEVEKRAKLDYILQKSTLDYNKALESLAFKKQFSETLSKSLASDSGSGYYFDSELNELHMTVPLEKVDGGKLSGVFDVQELASIHYNLLLDIIFEAALAISISFMLILIITKRLVLPLKNLSKHMCKEVDSIQIREIKERYRSDEIGDLARTFILLITEIQYQVSDLKQISNTDALTGLGSRHKYTLQAEALLKTTLLSGRNFALIVCDIDNFKFFNDSYGHAAGDSVIKAVAKAILETTGDNDKCYRIGGDEFIIVVPGYLKDEHIIKANNIRKAVEKANAEFKSNSMQQMVSISLGMAFIEAKELMPTISIEYCSLFTELFNKADQQLYIAKNRGRNNVASAKFIIRDSNSNK